MKASDEVMRTPCGYERSSKQPSKKKFPAVAQKSQLLALL